MKESDMNIAQPKKDDELKKAELEIHKSRTLHDATLLQSGAEYDVFDSGVVLNPSKEQKETLYTQLQKEHEKQESHVDTKKETRRQDALHELERLGFIEKKDGIVVCDIQKLQTEFTKEYIEKNSILYSFLRNHGKTVISTLHEIFGNMRVVSRDDYNEGIREPKNLFYNPENTANALNVEKIKNSTFYILPTDVAQKIPFDKTTYGDIDELDYREVLLPVFIYHPQYGNGYRDDKTGKLMVQKTDGAYQKYSSEYIRNNYGNLPDGENGGIATGRKYMRKVLPHLLQAGIVKLTDVELQDKNLKTEQNYRETGNKGYVTFDGVRHALGTQYKNTLTYKLNDTVGLVLQEDDNGNKNICATFNIISQKDADADYKTYKGASHKQTNPQPFNEEVFRQKGKDEEIEKYKKRIEDLEKFEYVLASEKYLREEFSINLEEFSTKEQFLIAQMLNSISVVKKERVYHLIINHGNDGLRTFVSFEHGGKEMGEKIFAISEHIDSKDADDIFEKYAELVDMAHDAKKHLQKDFPDADEEIVEEVAENLLKRGKTLLEQFADADMSRAHIVSEQLEKIKTENILLIERYKALKKEGVVSNISELKDINQKTYTQQEILRNPHILANIEELYVKNYTEYSESGLRDLITHLHQNIQKDGARIVALEKAQNVLSVMLVNENRNQKSVYLSALNIDPHIKETAAGRVLLEQVLHKYLNDGWRIEAEASPKNAQNYINQYEFIGYERSDDPDEDYILKLKKHKGHTYESQDKNVYTRQKIRQMAQENATEENGFIAVFVTEDTKETPHQLQEGFVITQMFRGKRDAERGNYFLLEKIQD